MKVFGTSDRDACRHVSHCTTNWCAFLFRQDADQFVVQAKRPTTKIRPKAVSLAVLRFSNFGNCQSEVVRDVISGGNIGKKVKVVT